MSFFRQYRAQLVVAGFVFCVTAFVAGLMSVPLEYAILAGTFCAAASFVVTVE